MNAQVQTQTTGIATIKPKRKYAKRKAKPKLTVVKPSVKKELPKTARAYLRTLGIAADKEGTAIKELIKMHSEMKKSSQEPAFANPDLLNREPAPVEPETLWGRFMKWLSK